MECKFCGKPTEVVDDVNVCNECCTVSFFKDIGLDQKQQLIMEYLNNVQKQLLEQQDYLHAIEQKHILGEKLSATELEIREKMIEFQSVRLELEAYIKINSHLNEKNERNLLYRLLILSKWLSKYFRRDA